jgi:hypothetical protein
MAFYDKDHDKVTKIKIYIFKTLTTVTQLPQLNLNTIFFNNK